MVPEADEAEADPADEAVERSPFTKLLKENLSQQMNGTIQLITMTA